MACGLHIVIPEDTIFGIAPPFDAVQSSLLSNRPLGQAQRVDLFFNGFLLFCSIKIIYAPVKNPDPEDQVFHG